jgi:glycerol-3-phosphate acyltransferase PlsX
MKIAIDAMGGDHAPDAIVKGALLATQDPSIKFIEIVLVGDENLIKKEFKVNELNGKCSISIIHTHENIGMADSPTTVLKAKQNSSIAVGINLLKEQKVDAFISAGNTGAVMASASLQLGRLKGILRPAIATVFPTKIGPIIMLDAGANVDCKPKNLLQFAIMGDVYVRYIFKNSSPKIALLSIGEENTKGNELTLESAKLITSTPLNFIGNIEGRDIFKGKADVIVCDGFVGNIVLKLAESLAEDMFSLLKKELSKSYLAKIGSLLCKGAFKNFKKSIDYSEYGGAPLLGVKKPCIICHGSSSPQAIKNAIKVAKNFVEQHLNEHISENIKLYNKN